MNRLKTISPKTIFINRIELYNSGVTNSYSLKWKIPFEYVKNIGRTRFPILLLHIDYGVIK